MPIPLYLLKRLLIALPTLLVISFLSFLLMRYDFQFGPYDMEILGQSYHVNAIEIKNPVDPLAELRNNPLLSKEAIEHEKERLGLDRPFHEQYGRWLSHVMRFDTEALKRGDVLHAYQPDLGTTFTGENVTTLIAKRIPNTLLLTVTTILVSWLVAIPLGIYAALHWRSTMDRLLTLLSSIGMALPSFVFALVLAVFATKTGWFPLGGVVSDNFDQLSFLGKAWDLVSHLALPVLVLTVGSLAGLQRQMRGNLLDVLQAEYVRTARAKGLPEHQVIYKHAVRTAINPMVTLLGFEFAALLGGAALTEMVLKYPGLGSLILDAALKSDTNMVMATLLMGAGMLVLGNLLGDVLLKVVDPRIELQ